MKFRFRLITVVMPILLSAPAVLSAQSADVTDGQVSMTFDGAFKNQLDAFGISAAAVNKRETNDRRSFKVTGGTIDLSSSEGEVQTTGRLRFTAGSMVIELKDLLINTGSGSPIVTAHMTLNGVAQGRVPVLQIITGPVFTTPLSLGTATAFTRFAIAPSFWSRLTISFQIPVVPPPATAGFLSFNITLAANAGLSASLTLPAACTLPESISA